MIHCIVPRDIAADIERSLDRFYRSDPRVTVVVERRGGERRCESDRRSCDAEAPDAERRRIHNRDGRRIGERRALTVPVNRLVLPRRAEPHAERLVFLERLDPPAEHLQDLDTGRLVTRIQAGNQDAFGELYMRYFDRIYTYLRIVLRESPDAEDAAQEVFVNLFEALPQYERREQPFEAWLFSIVRNFAINHLRRQNRLEVEDPEDIDRRRESLDGGADLNALAWLSDRDLLLLIERLSVAQRQVLILRYMMDLPTREIAAILDRSPEAVRQLHSRALGFLEDRLTSLGRKPAHIHREPMSRLFKQAWVLRARRFSLR